MLAFLLIGWIPLFSLGAEAPVQRFHVLTTEEKSTLQKNLLQVLTSQSFFKNASCREISNYLLNEAGLPALGETSSVKGERDNFFRGSPQSEPPQFNDGVTQRDKFRRHTHISGIKTQKGWNLELVRDLNFADEMQKSKKLHIQSTFHFAIRERSGESSCEFLDFDYLLMMGGEKDPVHKTLGAKECLDMFTKSLPDPKDVPQAATAALRFIRKDCALGLEYSASIKNDLLGTK
jgi:hypothetical protein